jgi:hypothetical protein
LVSEQPDIAVSATPPDAASRLGNKADELIKRQDIKQAVGSLIAARQLYSMARAGLEELLVAEGDDAPSLEEVFLHAVNQAALQPFEEAVLIRGFQETVFPWMIETYKAHTEAERATAAGERVEAERERRATAVPVGLTVEPGVVGLPRTRTLVLYGWRPAVLCALDKIAASASEAGSLVLRLSADRRPVGPPDGDFLVRISPNYWEGSANTTDAFHEMVALRAGAVLHTVPDLVVVDDLAEAYTSGLLGRAREARAADAQKRVRKWADKIGAAVVGGVPLLGDDVPEPSGLGWDNLKSFTTLLPVRVLPAAEGLLANHARLVVGSEFISFFDVPSSDLKDRGLHLLTT